ncbi:MAG: hypothetical protein AAFO94_01815 [Bacteroidota bacterium]
MGYKVIENLLEKYFAGECSLAEENRLKAYFSEEEVHEALIDYKPLFQYYQEEAEQHLNSDFDRKLLQQLSALQMEALIDTYFAGESTLEEEASLKTYFNGTEVATRHKVYQPLFQYFAAEAAVEPEAGFEERLVARIEQTERQRFRTRRLYPTLMRVAAVLVFALGVFYAVDVMRGPVNSGDGESYIKEQYALAEEEVTPEEAYKEVMAALALVSSKLNKGESKALESIGKIDKATKALR